MRFDQRSVFFDFDGVIKESLEIKGRAFEVLFEDFGEEVLAKVRLHHQKHTGMSRYIKIPLYLSWGSPLYGEKLVSQYVEKFSNIVTQKVIDSDWVPGVVEVLSAKRDNQDFFIVTATPQKEIEYILEKLDIASVFSQVVGAPENKINGINMLIDLFKINPSDALMIGDSSTDYIAADSNKIEFVLRRTTFNYQLQEKLDCHMINDYTQNNTFKGNAR